MVLNDLIKTLISKFVDDSYVPVRIPKYQISTPGKRKASLRPNQKSHKDEIEKWCVTIWGVIAENFATTSQKTVEFKFIVKRIPFFFSITSASAFRFLDIFSA